MTGVQTCALPIFVRVKVDGTRIVMIAADAGGAELDRYILAPPPVISKIEAGTRAGSLIRITGKGMGSEERTAGGAGSTGLAGVQVFLNGLLLRISYASTNIIEARLPVDIRGSATIRVATANGSSEKSI